MVETADIVASLLSTIEHPSQLRELSQEDLQQIVDELRLHIIHTLNGCGGHFAGNLGTIELTVALHTIFDTPHDRVIWDVGHQAYAHKVLTGRYHQLKTIRQANGLAPFIKRGESEFDCFGVGHSSTSISAAAGMAFASQLQDIERKSIAVIGDGGMTAGMVFEALNHVGDSKADVLVILNDNDMSISPNVGALSNYFTRIISGPVYSGMRDGSRKILSRVPPLKQLARRTEMHMKGMFSPGTLFEELGFQYFGPIDGHDLKTLTKTLNNLKNLNEPRLLHIVTKKGKGYPEAEADPIKYHAVSAGFLQKDQLKATEKTDEVAPKKVAPKTLPTYSQVFGDWLCDIAEQDSKVVGITPAMREGSGLVEFSERFPERYFDVGIAEQHSVTVAAGFACEGMKPVVAIYSTFLQRAYDQLIHDVAIQNLNVLFAIDRAGLVGADGPTHAGSFDFSYLRCIPNMLIMAPSDENECRQMLYTGYQYQGPAAVRYPRGTGPGVAIDNDMREIPIGKAERYRDGEKTAILSFGALLPSALEAAEQLNATLINMRFVKPLDTEIIREVAETHQLLVTLEENVIMGGAGSAVLEYLNEINLQRPVLQLGLPDKFIEHGNPKQMLADCGLDAKGIAKSIQQHLATL